MRNEPGTPEFDDSAAVDGTVDNPLGDATPAKTRVGARATILAGLTLATLGVAALTPQLSTVVSINNTVA